MKVTVTGADGLLGSNLVRLLLETGHQVRVLLEEGRRSGTLDGLDIERSYGNILDAQALVNAFSGSQVVIHAAASTSIWPARSAFVRDVNINGTANVINAAEQAQIDRFIYIGTANSFTPGSKTNPGREDSPYDAARFGLDYMDSKYEAQQLVLAAVRERQLPALTVNPTFMIGPYDATPSSGTMLIRLYQRKVMGHTAGGKCYVHVRDVATAIVNAITMGRTGESYIAGNLNLDYAEFFTLAAAVMGVAAPGRHIPKPVVLGIGLAQSATATLTGKPPLLGYAAARLACEDFYYDPAKARQALAMPATPMEVAVCECFDWLKTHGYLQKPA